MVFPRRSRSAHISCMFLPMNSIEPLHAWVHFPVSGSLYQVSPNPGVCHNSTPTPLTSPRHIPELKDKVLSPGRLRLHQGLPCIPVADHTFMPTPGLRIGLGKPLGLTCNYFV